MNEVCMQNLADPPKEHESDGKKTPTEVWRCCVPSATRDSFADSKVLKLRSAIMLRVR
ncbi:uncharacterized protein PGTG_22062 [Puccinia graminis f. sp. tritici CRL 75-36-700-3]|uniref:Uncharacterized protein n=1 Tax=Puccinia graminis f. sp. tritici (strain CRL 75-36-700-3 / race SCCL) TaxID=418459 RepID=H6QTM5_PUCGT|nr:uncharacterized protein PGTG_22062 [Puccinia graminis f. sp. tritici CRL 75-36-700-3]EHS64236.1 hypothetical protein PGTG_22062 [Puccinia graminis f. sp. tritici CRL 75-36-700-3]